MTQIIDFCVHDEACLMYLIFIFCERVPEDKMLTDILKPYIDPVESDPVVCQRCVLNNFLSNSLIKERSHPEQIA